MYKKVFASTDSLASKWVLKGCIREDVSAQKVFYKPVEKEEVLLYSFNVKVNDTIQLFDFRLGAQSVCYNTIVAIDSVIIDRNLTKRIKISSIRDPAEINVDFSYWIEGVGGNKGLLTSSLPLLLCGETSVLLCNYQQGSLKYKSSDEGFNECFIWGTTGLTDNSATKKIEIYPNPLVEKSTIVLPGSYTNTEMALYNPMGKLIEKKVISPGNNTIEKGNRPTGIYVYKILRKGQIVSTGKLIVQ